MTPENATHEEWEQACAFLRIESKYAQRST